MKKANHIKLARNWTDGRLGHGEINAARLILSSRHHCVINQSKKLRVETLTLKQADDAHCCDQACSFKPLYTSQSVKTCKVEISEQNNRVGQRGAGSVDLQM